MIRAMINEQGSAQLFLIGLLLVGMVSGVYLVQQKTDYLPQAANSPIKVSFNFSPSPTPTPTAIAHP